MPNRSHTRTLTVNRLTAVCPFLCNCARPEYVLLLNATANGLVSEAADIDPAVLRLLTRRVQVGDLDLEDAPYTNISYAVVDSPAHRALARQVVRESVVLLSNGGGSSSGSGRRSDAPSPPLPLHLLPGDALLIRNLLVVGPSADDPSVQAHTYHGTPAAWTTVLAGLRAIADPSVTITVLPGCSRTGSDTSGFPAALAAASIADAVVYVGGLQASIEEEDTDRGSFELPGVQLALIQALHNATAARLTPVVAVIVSGGPVSEPWMASANASRLGWLWVSYFGQDGAGVADVIAGAYSPSGRLPFTMPVDTSQVGDITDYDMRGPPFGRTYRYLRYPTSGGEDGFAELDGVEVNCGASSDCLTGWPSCDNSSVPGQCTFPRGNAVALCAAWPSCQAVTCNGDRSDCQARSDATALQSSGTFTSYVRGFASVPLFPFAWGLSYSTALPTALTVDGGADAAFAFGSTVSLTAHLSASDRPADVVVALFGAFLQCDGVSASPVPALPLRSLLTFAKVAAAVGAPTSVPLSFELSPLRLPGVERQAFPGFLRVWVGDGGVCAGCPSVTLRLSQGGTSCIAARGDEL